MLMIFFLVFHSSGYSATCKTMNSNHVTEEEVLSLIISQLVAYGYSAVAQSVADTTGAPTDMMPSSRLSELIQIAKDKSNFYSS